MTLRKCTDCRRTGRNGCVGCYPSTSDRSADADAIGYTFDTTGHIVNPISTGQTTPGNGE